MFLLLTIVKNLLDNLNMCDKILMEICAGGDKFYLFIFQIAWFYNNVKKNEG